MKKSDSAFISRAYFFWLIGLLIAFYEIIRLVPLGQQFLGGGVSNYLTSPFLWVWGNFDGEHYLAIAQNGYRPLTYFFFPLFPMLIKFVSLFIGASLKDYLISGLLVSHISLIFALVGLYKLIEIDGEKNLARRMLILLLLFPTSFFFGSVYTESLFLALTVWSFYFARKGKWFLAALLGGCSSATRIVGLALFPALLVEYLKTRKVKLDVLWLLLIPLGLGFYTIYLWLRTKDPLNFFNTVSIFGAQRSSTFVFLPQVFYRYIFKILPNLNYTVLTSFFPGVLEFVIALAFLSLSILAFWRIRLSYAVFLAVGYLIPTLSGSFSSLPRYVLVLFPAFILMAKWLSKSKLLLFVFCIVSAILLLISFALFARGYWIS
jgi:Gpi18-like mannosyltransferase